MGDYRPVQVTKYAMNQLKPVLNERHVNMMSFSQCIGIGLFLQNGRTMFLAGPGLATLAYFLAGTVMWSSAACLGEMTALFPVKGPIFELPRRFLDESLGYAAGWITWFSWIVLIAAELVAITHIFQFKYPPEQLLADGYPGATLEWMPHISPTVIVMIFLVVLLLLNLLPVRHFGQMEYIFGVIKLCFIVTMIVLNTVLHSWDRAKRGHFWTYNTPYSFGSQNLTLPNGHVVEGAAGKLGGMWEAMLTCLFGMIGFETVAITAAENRDLRTEETVKLATRKISLRIITLYCLATFTVSLNVPYTHPLIQDHAVISFGYGQNSAFVISTVLNHLRVWPYFINCFIIFSASTAGANGIYNASRTLHALASIQDAWPQWGVVQAVRRRLERTYYGVPLGAVVFSWMFGLLGFLGSNASSARILGRMVRCVVVSMLIVYAVIALSFLEFYKTLKVAASGDDETIDDKDEPTTRQRYDRNCPQYPYRSHGQWLRALYAFVACSLFILFNGWRTFVSPMHTADFVACYIPILLFAVISMLYQIKLNGWNPLNWRRRASRELQNPPPQFATSSPRRGHIAFKDPENLFTGANFRALVRWIWVWMK